MVSAFDVAWSLLKGDPRAYTDYPVIDRLIRQQRLKRLGMVDADIEMNPLEEHQDPKDKLYHRGSGDQMLRFKTRYPELYQQIAEQARMSAMKDPYQNLNPLGDGALGKITPYNRLFSLHDLYNDAFMKPMPENPTHNYMDDEMRRDQKYHDYKGYKFELPQDYFTSFEPHPTKDFDDLVTEQPSRGAFNIEYDISGDGY